MPLFQSSMPVPLGENGYPIINTDMYDKCIDGYQGITDWELAGDQLDSGDPGNEFAGALTAGKLSVFQSVEHLAGGVEGEEVANAAAACKAAVATSATPLTICSI